MIQQQNHAEICPVCKGTGKYEQITNYGTSAKTYYQSTCHGCQGKGWVIVPETTSVTLTSTIGEPIIIDLTKDEIPGQINLFELMEEKINE